MDDATYRWSITYFDDLTQVTGCAATADAALRRVEDELDSSRRISCLFIQKVGLNSYELPLIHHHEYDNGAIFDFYFGHLGGAKGKFRGRIKHYARR